MIAALYCIVGFISCCTELTLAAASARVPASAPAGPARPRVLFLTHTAGFEHDVVRRGPHGELSLAETLLPRMLGPAWDVDSTKDCARINADELADTQVLVFHTTGELPIPESGKAALFRWIEHGGGFVGLHCATDTLYQCAQYMQLVGAAFDGHPWHQQVRVRAFDEPPVAFLRGGTYATFDEIYQFKAQPQDVRVCLELDMSSVDATKGKHARNLVAWWKPVGDGRMVYNSLGHGAEAWTAPLFQDLVREAVRFAAGERARPCVDSGAFESAQAAFLSLSALSRADGAALWGAPLDGPVLIVDPDTRVALANRSDAQGELVPLVDGVWTAVLPAELQLANTALEWNGTLWSMLQTPLPEDAPQRDVLLVHESFHRLQQDPAWNGPEAPENQAACAHLDEREARTWLRLELRALAAAVAATDPAAAPSPAAVAGPPALRAALLFRARRRDLYASSTEAENALELHEGLAEYTGLRLAYPETPARLAALHAELLSRETTESFVRSFAYATGSAYGTLLDCNAAAGDWRARALAGESPAKLLYLAHGIELPVSAVERTRLAEELASSYGGAEIAADEARRFTERRARSAVDRARYAGSTRLVLRPGASNSYSFDPNRVRTLEGVGSVYDSASVSDAWGVLDAPGGALRDAEGRWIVPGPLGDARVGKLAGDGYTLELSPGWRLAAGERAGEWRVEAVR
jgi:type 1 glutamine amidotransferase